MTLYAAIENIEAAQYDINTRRAAYSPRLDFRARTENTENYLGARGDRDFNVAELVVNWNLFNGGSDKAREKQYTERKHLAIEMREKACRDTRQTLLIAYNAILVGSQSFWEGVDVRGEALSLSVMANAAAADIRQFPAAR